MTSFNNFENPVLTYLKPDFQLSGQNSKTKATMLCPNLCGMASLPPLALTSSTPNVWIELANTKENIYTTSDEVRGHVNIEVEREIPLDRIDISFEGISSTSLSRAIAFVPGRRESCQKFLQLRQPTNELDYPKLQTLVPGQKYQLPFSFIIPEHLLPQCCNHETRNAGVKHAHLRLPPTLGSGPTPFWDLRSTPDDSPEMCRIKYGVRVQMFGKSSPEPICDLSQDIRVMPATPKDEKTDDLSVLYMLKEQPLTSGLSRREHGNLEISATKPTPINLHSTETGSINASPTALQLHLRFDPVKNELPPRLSSLKCNLDTSTYYATVPWENYPSQKDISPLQVDREVYEKSMSLSSLDLSSVTWEKLPSFSAIYSGKLKGDDESDASFIPSEEQIESWSQCSYTATVTVPIVLPTKKDFLPTFHSCSVSRSYAFDISLGYRMSSGLCGSSTNLSVPVEMVYAGKE